HSGRVSFTLHDACFFCLGFRRCRDLHSFPTRRSSDLLPARWCWVSSTFRQAAPRRASIQSLKTGCPRSRMSARTSRSARTRQTRSEEHTSELQSRENLVCRLLLEKKKKTTTDTAAGTI